MIKKQFLYFIYFFSFSAFSQIGGKHGFEFLNVPGNARLAALGGVNVSLNDRDLNFFFSNPSLVSDSLSGWASAGHQFYVADIGQSVFSYGPSFKAVGMVVFGVQHIGYGSMTAYDETGFEIGDFKSGETAVVISKSHQTGNFRLGVNLKGVFSSIAGFRSSALMLDLGGVFIHPEQHFTVGLVIRNAGVLLSDYSETSDTTLPFDVQAGATFKPEHMPLRFSLTAYNLTRADIVYNNPDDGNDKPGTLDKVLRHLNFGTELLLHRNFNVLFGYNYFVHKELKLEETGGGAGISVGISGRVKSFEFAFSRSGYIAGAAGYAFTLATDLNNMLIRR